MVKKFLMVTVSVLSLQSACFAGKGDVDSIVSDPSKVLKTEVIAPIDEVADVAAPKKVSTSKKIKKFFAGCFACLKVTGEVVDQVSDITKDGLNLASQIDAVTGGNHQENINKAIGIVDAIDATNGIVVNKLKVPPSAL